jgi:mRNA interferase MazF
MKGLAQRGDVWLVNWNPARGSEQAGKRPAFLIIQNDVGNEYAFTTIVAALSTTIRSYPMNVLLEPPEGGLSKPSIVKTSQILTVSKERLEKKLGAITPEKMQEVDQALRLSLAL